MTDIPILNTRGAALYLGTGTTWIRKLVDSGKLKAFIYDNAGKLVERPQDAKRQGAALFFREADLKKHLAPQKQTKPAQGRRYSDEQREEVRRLHDAGLSSRQIAERLNISRQTVNNWLAEKQKGEQAISQTNYTRLA